MFVMAITTVTEPDAFWGAVKHAYATLPAGAGWVLAVASTDGTRAVNVIAHDSVESVRALFEGAAAAFGTTECLEADAANAVGLAT
jgi:hypothetical protein